MAPQKEFKGGQFFPVVLDDLRRLVICAAAKRRMSASTFGHHSTGSNATGSFANGENANVRMRQLFGVLWYHQFTVALRDSRFETEAEITTMNDLQTALFDAVQRRGLTVDRARKDAGIGSTLISFIRQSYNQNTPNANISATILLPFLEFYGLQLVITDELSPVITRARRAARRAEALGGS